MDNPWTTLPEKPPYVLPQDHAMVNAANRKNVDWRFRFQLELLPDPYIGSLNAPVVLLTLNPGYTRAEPGDGNCNDDWWHANSNDLHDAYRTNFRGEPTEYPMFFLDPKFSNNPGGRYWSRRFGELTESCGREQVARNLVTVEFFPYHSNKFKGGCRVPSQKFALHQIQRAMDREALIVIVRAREALLRDVPGLSQYRNVVTVNSPLSGYISRGNMPEFQRVVTAINHDKR